MVFSPGGSAVSLHALVVCFRFASSCANPIACENELPGTPQSVWDMNSSEGSTIQGFADPFSVNLGDSINFKVQSAATSYIIDIYRMGYYGGDGARLVTTLTPEYFSVAESACLQHEHCDRPSGLRQLGNIRDLASSDHGSFWCLYGRSRPDRRHHRHEPDPVCGNRQREYL